MFPASRRDWLRRASILPAALAAGISCRHGGAAGRPRDVARLFFVSRGRTWVIGADGTGLRALEFTVPNQATWQPGGFFSDGRRVLMLSMEPRRDGPGRPFEEYYTRTPTHLWIHDLETGGLEEIATRERRAVFYTPQLLLGDHQLLVQVVKDRVGQIYRMNLDGTGAVEFTKAGEGLPYGLSLSPDGRRVAYHLASPQGYQIWTSATDGSQRRLVAAHGDLLYFAPAWSPDGEWLAFQGCRFRTDPGHDWSDVYLCRPDGRELRALTSGQAMWFGATYGPKENRGGGSNVVTWTLDGALLFPRRSPEARVAWEYQAARPDLDHFNREFKPELARGGTAICRLHPGTGAATWLTRPGEGVWDFRASESPVGRQVAFCRVDTGGSPALWVMDADGRNPMELNRGENGQGADHPRWLPRRR